MMSAQNFLLSQPRVVILGLSESFNRTANRRRHDGSSSQIVPSMSADAWR